MGIDDYGTATSGTGTSNTLTSGSVDCLDGVLLISWGNDNVYTVTGVTGTMTLSDEAQYTSVYNTSYYKTVTSGAYSETATYSGSDNVTSIAICISAN